MPLTATRLDAPPDPLVDADWLESRLGHPALRVLDVRGRHPSSPKPHAKRTEYEAGHIEGAALVDWERDFVDQDDPIPYQAASPEVFAQGRGQQRFDARERERLHRVRMQR